MDRSQHALEEVRNIAMRKAYIPLSIRKYVKFHDDGRVTIEIK